VEVGDEVAIRDRVKGVRADAREAELARDELSIAPAPSGRTLVRARACVKRSVSRVNISS
jgi:hypothetical protein